MHLQPMYIACYLELQLTSYSYSLQSIATASSLQLYLVILKFYLYSLQPIRTGYKYNLLSELVPYSYARFRATSKAYSLHLKILEVFYSSSLQSVRAIACSLYLQSIATACSLYSICMSTASSITYCLCLCILYLIFLLTIQSKDLQSILVIYNCSLQSMLTVQLWLVVYTWSMELQLMSIATACSLYL